MLFENKHDENKHDEFMQCVASCTKYFKKQSLRTVNPYSQLTQ